eukprot:1276180-Rhodomonas_salina.2
MSLAITSRLSASTKENKGRSGWSKSKVHLLSSTCAGPSFTRICHDGYHTAEAPSPSRQCVPIPGRSPYPHPLPHPALLGVSKLLPSCT